MPMILSPVTITANTTLTKVDHAETFVNLGVASGCTVTLPAASGTGLTFHFNVATTVTSNSYVVAANGSDVIQGGVIVATDTGGLTIPTSATSDKITLNGGTTGGLKGSNFVLKDIASGTWAVSGFLVSTDAEATPFAAS